MICLCNYLFLSIIQHIKIIEKPQVFLVFKIQLLGKYDDSTTQKDQQKAIRWSQKK